MGIKFEKSKKISDQPTNTGKTGLGKGKQNNYKVGLMVYVEVLVK